MSKALEVISCLLELLVILETPLCEIRTPPFDLRSMQGPNCVENQNEMRTPPLIRTLYAWSQLHRKVYKTTPEMRTSPLIRTTMHLSGSAFLLQLCTVGA